MTLFLHPQQECGFCKFPNNKVSDPSGYISPESVMQVKAFFDGDLVKPKRPSWPEYGIILAKAACTRSEDLTTQVGAIAFDSEWNVKGSFYNGFLPKQDVSQEIWQDRDFKNKHVIHAEHWLVSKTKANKIKRVCMTHSPCYKCAPILAAHGVKEVYFEQEYHRDQEFKETFKLYNIKWEEIKL